ncbi:hypothetical protein Bbelb_393260 [Branchiostoma belcheri]|nr:hypothetical protein Bbelb_393260 [Branchiostoma belcheri]
MSSMWEPVELCNRVQRVRWDSCISAPRPVLAGTPQGGIISPCLFVPAMNSLDNNIPQSVTPVKVPAFKLLGVIVSNDLSWGTHVEYMLSKVRPPLHYLRLSKRVGLPVDVLLQIYNIFVRPVLEYAIIGIPYDHLQTLESRRCEAAVHELTRVMTDATHPCQQFLEPEPERIQDKRTTPRFNWPAWKMNGAGQWTEGKSKAFDKVWHKGLLANLCAHGIRGPILQWFHSYLSERRQRVVIQDGTSEWKSPLAGVPQGDLCSVSNWLTQWKLETNRDKCKVMYITTRNIPRPHFRRRFHKVTTLYKLLNGHSPPHFQTLIPRTRASATESRYPLRNSNHLTVELTKTTRGQRTFFHRATSLWNTLSTDARTATTIVSFKRKL